MTRRLLPRLLASAATLAGLVAALTLFAGSGFAQGSAAQANYAPQNTNTPTIGGAATVGATLSATTGSWNSQSQLSYSYQWERCDTKGNGCSDVPGATGSAYVVQAADADHTLRVVVTAHNASGAASATSAQTDVVGQPAPSGAIKLPDGKTSIPATSVTLPDRLVIDGVQFQPTHLRSRAQFIARFHVSDVNGSVVRGALVYALGLPYSWVEKSVEVTTDTEGWANVPIKPSAKMPLSRGQALVIFVRARVEGQNVLGGATSRRLVQITTG